MRESVGPYRLLERLGEDRLGEIHKARDTARGRTTAVRILHASIAGDPVRRAALLEDARRVEALSHPSLAALFDVIEEDDMLALVHEHVEGKTLAATLGGTPLNPRLAAAIGIQLADGLAEMHASGLAHGAVDADHVVINPRGQAKLIDPGLTAWVATGARGSGAAADEQAVSVDITALGALLAQMTGASMPRAQWADDLRAVIERTRPSSARRYESVPTFAAELRAVAAMLEARAEAAAPLDARRSGASTVVWLVVAVVLLALGFWLLSG